MPAPKALAVRPMVATPTPVPAQERTEAPPGSMRPRVPMSQTSASALSASNAAMTAVLTSGRGPAQAPPGAQDMVGNGAVAAAGRADAVPLQSAGAEVAPPEPAAAAAAPQVKARPGPEADAKFAALKKDVRHKKRSLAGSHPPARAEAVAAQDAARPPKDDQEAQGKSANAEKMDEARPKEFDKEAFIRAVEEAIAQKAPKNLDEADKFADSGKAGEVRAEVRGKVGEGRTEAAEQIATTTAAPPDTSKAVTKTVVPLTSDRPPRTPATPDPAKAVPDKLPPSATDLSAGPAAVNQQMADAQVTEPQMAKANEPSFTKALGEKKAAEQHSAQAPGRMRRHEANQLRTTTAQAQRLGAAAMGAMAAQRVRTGQQVGQGKSGAQSRDEEKRAQVTAVLQGVFDTMKKDVEGILDGLDKLVDKQFDDGEKQARADFTAEHKRKMEEYKDRRYSGWSGKWHWVRDKFAGLPAEADKIFDEARNNYIRRMRQVISDVANTVAAELAKAKQRIARGRKEMADAVDKLPADLKAIGRQAAAEFSSKFDELTQTVDDKGTQLVDTLATKYTEALKSVDDEIATEKEKNKGLVAKAVDAVKGVIETILELKRLLLSVLAKAASAVMMILKDPIGFLRNLVSAVGAGLRQFLKNIATHLQQGILSWLLGKATEAGLELPAKFDTKGVLTMLASLVGLTWQSIRARIVRKAPQLEPAIGLAESAVPLVAEVRKQGVAGMWDDLKTRLGDLRKDLLDKVIQYVTPTIVVAGIMWVISLLNPASAFVRAVKLIIDIVRFIVTQARQIYEFVNSVLDSVIAIARGATGGVPALIERSLARSIPVLLGVLAAVLGVGGIAARVKQIVQAMTKPVTAAVDWVIDKIVGLLKKLWSKIKGSKLLATIKGKAAALFSWISQKITGKTIAKPFAMASGEPHTLTAHPSGSSLKITIASAFAGEIRAVMTQVKAEANKLPGPEKSKALSTLSGIETQLARMSEVEKKWLSGKAAAEKAVKARVQNRIQKKKIKTKEEAEALSKQWLAEKEQRLYQPIEKLLADQIKELSHLKSMKQFVQVTGVRRLPPGYDVRTRLYVLGSGWKAQSSAWRTQEKKKLVDTVRTALALGKTPAARAKLVNLDDQFKLPDNALELFDKGRLKASLVEETAYDVDHSPVPLAQHWKAQGYNTGDVNRRAHTVDKGNWRLITHSKNTSLQAGGHQYHQQRDLGESFTSELADGGIPNAKRIDGRPLLDKNERPIV